MIRAGQLDRRITIMRPGITVDGEYGPQPGTPTVFAARVPAQVLDDLPSQTEENGGALREAERPSRVRIRYLRGITSDMYIILHDEVDTTHQISAPPAEIGRRDWTEFPVRQYSS